MVYMMGASQACSMSPPRRERRRRVVSAGARLDSVGGPWEGSTPSPRKTCLAW